MAPVAVDRAGQAKRRRLIEHVSTDATVRPWYPHQAPAQLGDVTHGHGPRARFKLLNSLIDTIPKAQRTDGLVLSHDDYSFPVGSQPALVIAGPVFGLDLFQPARARLSSFRSPFLRRVATVVRRTTFVEQGPLVALFARAQDARSPLYQNLGMGWGAEGRWAQVAREQQRLGMVDALPIHHITGESNDRSAQLHQPHAVLEEAGIASLDEQERSHSPACDGQGPFGDKGENGAGTPNARPMKKMASRAFVNHLRQRIRTASSAGRSARRTSPGRNYRQHPCTVLSHSRLAI